MIPVQPAAQNDGDLQQLLAAIETVCFQPTERLCSDILQLVTDLHAGDAHQAASLYTGMSKKLVNQAGHYLRMCRYSLFPYISELAGKEEDGHDCRNCSSTCALPHTSQVRELARANEAVRETIRQLRAIEHPKDVTPEHRPQYESLWATNDLLSATLTILVSVTEWGVLPQILSLQTAINAHA